MSFRDSFVRVEKLDALTEHFADQLRTQAFSGARKELARRHEDVVEQLAGREAALEEVAGTLETARLRVADWPISDAGFKALCGGLRRVYKRGYKRFEDAYASPPPSASIRGASASNT